MTGHPTSDSQEEIERFKSDWRQERRAAHPEVTPPQPAQPTAEQPTAPAPRVYVVQQGDSLSQIAKNVYGDASRWREIYEANKDGIKDPKIIRPGQELRIP
jgi:nucleoid-associated protein YgaU